MSQSRLDSGLHYGAFMRLLEMSEYGRVHSRRRQRPASEEAVFKGTADLIRALRSKFPGRALRPLESIEVFASYLVGEGVENGYISS
jgi:hypothetical protein